MVVRGCKNCGHESHCDGKLYKDFGEQKEIVAIREVGGADLSSTTPITQISNFFMG